MGRQYGDAVSDDMSPEEVERLFGETETRTVRTAGPQRIRNTGDPDVIDEWINGFGLNVATPEELQALQLRSRTMREIRGLEQAGRDALGRGEPGKTTMEIEATPDGYALKGIRLPERQSSANGCWSCAYQLMLQSKGVILTQEQIRDYRPELTLEEASQREETNPDIVGTMNGDRIMNPHELADLALRTIPNCAMNSATIAPYTMLTPQERGGLTAQEYRDRVVDYFKEKAAEAILEYHTPIAVLENGHYRTVIGLDGDYVLYKDSLSRPSDVTHRVPLRDFLAPVMDAESGIEFNWLSDIHLTKDKKTITGLPREGVTMAEDGTLVFDPKHEAERLPNTDFRNRLGLEALPLQLTGRVHGVYGQEKTYLPAKLPAEFLKREAESRLPEDEIQLAARERARRDREELPADRICRRMEGLIDHVSDIAFHDIPKEEMKAFDATEANEIERATGIRVKIGRSSGQNMFYTWLVAEKGYSIDQVYELRKHKTTEEIRGLFEEYKTDLKTNYRLGPDGARRMGEMQRKMVDALEGMQFPDTAPRTPEEITDLTLKYAWLQSLLVDMGQDTEKLTGLTGAGEYDPERTPAYYEGAGGKENIDARMQHVHGVLIGVSRYLGHGLPSKDRPADVANRVAMFLNDWTDYRGKKIGDVRVPGFATQAGLSDGIGFVQAPAEANLRPTQANAYLQGRSDALPWQHTLMKTLADKKDLAREGVNGTIRAAGYELSAVTMDPRRISDVLPADGPDFHAMTPEQRKQVTGLYMELFNKDLDRRVLEPLYDRGKDAFDAIRIDGRSVREVAEAMETERLAKPASDGKEAKPLTAAEKEQFMQMLVLKNMGDPEHQVTISLPQTQKDGTLTELPPIELTSHKKEIRLGAFEDYYKDVDMVAAASALLMEGPGKIPNEGENALCSSFEMIKEKAVPKSQRDKLAGFGKDMYDCIMINGKSVNRIYEENYAVPGVSQTREKMIKDALITAYRMDPDSRVEIWRVDERSDQFILTDPISIGIQGPMKGLTPERERQINERSSRLTAQPITERRAQMITGTGAGFTPGVTPEKVKQIDELYYKMAAEKQGWHRDSDEYRKMKEAVAAVHDAAGTYDPTDPDAKKAMEALFADLEEKAKAYADKEAYKSKSTERGVTRKNTALSILDTIDGGVEGNVVDLRQKKGEAKGTHRTFRDLMKAEKEATSKTYGTQAEAARKARRKKAEAEKAAKAKKADPVRKADPIAPGKKD